MTNLEWLIKNDVELIRDILPQHLSKEKGILKRCGDTQCVNCDFNSSCHSTCTTCTDATKEWLEAEHEPLYKRGDIVVTSRNKLLVIKKGEHDGNTVAVSSYIDDCEEWVERIPVTDIKKIVGHMEESE